mgnify:CR=1 FL=1
MSFRNLTPISLASMSFAQKGTDTGIGMVGTAMSSPGGDIYHFTEHVAGEGTNVVNGSGDVIIRYHPNVKYWISIQNISTGASGTLRSQGLQAKWYGNNVTDTPTDFTLPGGHFFWPSQNGRDNLSACVLRDSGGYYPQGASTLNRYLDLYPNDIVYGRFDRIALENGTSGQTTRVLLVRGE